MVTANDENDEDYERQDVPANTITVECSHEVVYDRSIRESQGHESGSEDLHKVGSGSTEDFFRKY